MVQERVDLWAKELADALRLGSGQLGTRSAAIEFLHHAYVHGGAIADEEKLFLTELLFKVREILGHQVYSALQATESCTPLDDVCQILIQLDVIERHENQALSRSGLIQSYSSKALAQIDQIVSRQRLTDSHLLSGTSRVFTIDDPWSRDLDDAFSVSFQADNVIVGIHIVNVVNAIPFDSPLEHEARRRGSTVYCPDKNFHMFPTVLAESCLSLIPNEPRECISIICTCSKDGSVANKEFKLCTLTSETRLTYNEVESILAGEASDFSDSIHFLHRMAKCLQSDRGADDRDGGEQDFKLAYDRETGQVDCEILPMSSPSRQLVAELMVLYNRSVADYCCENEVPILYKTQAALANDDTKPNDSLPKRYAPSQWSVHPQPHDAMGFARYTRASSPLRSYVDYIVQAQLVGDLSEQDLILETTLEQALPSLIEAQKRVRVVQRESRNYWWLEYMRQKNLEGGIVEGVHIKHDAKESLFRVRGTELVVSTVPSELELGTVVKLEVLALHPVAALANVRFASHNIQESERRTTES